MVGEVAVAAHLISAVSIQVRGNGGRRLARACARKGEAAAQPDHGGGGGRAGPVTEVGVEVDRGRVGERVGAIGVAIDEVEQRAADPWTSTSRSSCWRTGGCAPPRAPCDVLDWAIACVSPSAIDPAAAVVLVMAERDRAGGIDAMEVIRDEVGEVVEAPGPSSGSGGRLRRTRARDERERAAGTKHPPIRHVRC